MATSVTQSDHRRFETLVALAGAAGQGRCDLAREECLAATRAFAQARQEETLRRHRERESGSNIVHLLSDAADDILKGVFQLGLAAMPGRRNLSSRISLCARGGYGRSELNPKSDLDVCLIFEGELTDDLREFNGFLVSFLWDIGFEVGYSLHPVEQAMELVQEDLPTFTSFLESRLIAGSNAGFARVKLFIRELQSGEFGRRFIERRIRERHEDLSPEHRDSFSPEPNIKESAGGLRDFHTALWLLMMAYGVNTIDDVMGQSLVTPEEHLEFVEGLDFLWRIRNELHFHTGDRTDRLTFAHQRHVARAFGYGEGAHHDVGRFMADYYVAASKLRRFFRIAAGACDPTSSRRLPEPEVPEETGVRIEGGLLYAGHQDPDWFTHNPARLMRVYWESARHGAHLSHITERLVAQSLHLADDAFRSNDVVRRLVVAICNRPYQSGHAFRHMAAVGLLGRYIPEFAAVQGIIRYEDFHHYPVDEHTLRAVESLAQISDMDGPVGYCLREALENLSDPYILVLAILCHDLGKAAGEVHTDESVRLVHEICPRMGLREEDEERIAFLVQHHILMTHISQYRDIDDEDIIRSFAETMKTEQRLRALFVLSYADLFAVGPDVWNEWKGALLMRLFLRTERQLLGRAETVGEEYWKSAKAEQIRALVPKELRDRVEDHLQGLGDRYFVAFLPEQIALHIDCVARAQQTGLAVYGGAETPTGTSEVIVCTRDRHGLFSAIAGAFSARLIDITGAALFTRPDGWVVDSFAVSDAHRQGRLGSAQLERVENLLRAVLFEDEDIQTHVDQARKRIFALLQPRLPVKTRIEFDNDSSRTHTVIDIDAGDRTGLLYDIAQAMSESGLDIATARIVTDVRHVRDSFYVTRAGTKIENEGTQAEVREAIHHAIHPRAATDTGRPARP